MQGWKQGLLAVFLVLALFTFSGCMQVITERGEDGEIPAVKAGTTCPLADERVPETETVLLSFLSGDAQSLLRNERNIRFSTLEEKAQQCLDLLLAGPAAGERGTWPEVRGRTGGQVRVSGNIAICSLPARYRQLEPEELYAVRVAVASTMCQLKEISSCVVLVDGREEGMDLAATRPAGAFTGMESPSLESALKNADGTAACVLFIPSADGNYLVGQVKRLSLGNVDPSECMYRVLEALGVQGGKVPPPLGYLAEMPEITKTEDGQYKIISLHFSASLDTALAGAGLSRGIYAGMLCESLLCFVPGVDGLSITIGQDRLGGISAREMPGNQAITFTQNLMMSGDFAQVFGSEIRGYLPGEGGRLTAVSLTVPAREAASPKVRLLALEAAGGEAYGGSALLSYRMESDKIALNLDRKLLDIWKQLPEGQALPVLSAVVNTITEGVVQDEAVLFFSGAQAEETLQGIALQGALYRNVEVLP